MDPKITDFLDYRHFLHERFLSMKKANSKISYRYLARRVGTTDNYFKYIFDRKKNISVDRVFKVANAFNLNPEETQILLFKIISHGVHEPQAKETLKRGLLKADFREPADSWLSEIVAKMQLAPDFLPDMDWVQKKITGDPHYSELEKVLNTSASNLSEVKKLLEDFIRESSEISRQSQSYDQLVAIYGATFQLTREL